LFVVFILLSFYLAIWLYSNYTATKEYSDTTTKTALACSYFSFSLSKIEYSIGELSFDIESRVSEEKDAPKEMVIQIGSDDYELKLGQYFDFKQHVDVPIFVNDEFNIFPKGCQDYNKKKCS